MPCCRLKTIGRSKDLQVLKLGAPNTFINHANTEELQLLYSQNHKAAEYTVIFDAQFNDSTGDGIRLNAHILKNAWQIIRGNTCIFKIFKVDLNTWAETLVYTVSGTGQSNGMFTATATEANLSTSIEGEFTFAVEVTLKRLNRTLKQKFYINNLGIFDSVVRLRNKIKFLEITKKDE